MADIRQNPQNQPTNTQNEEATRPNDQRVLAPDEAAQTINAVETQKTKSVGVSELETLKLLSEQTGMPYVDLSNFNIDLDLLKIVPFHVAQTYKVFPLKRTEDGSLLIAISDPMNIKIMDDLRLLLDQPVQGAIASESDIDDAINMYYGIGDENLDDMVEHLHHDNVEEKIVEDNTQIDLTNLERIGSDAPVIKYVNCCSCRRLRTGHPIYILNRLKISCVFGTGLTVCFMKCHPPLNICISVFNPGLRLWRAWIYLKKECPRMDVLS